MISGKKRKIRIIAAVSAVILLIAAGVIAFVFADLSNEHLIYRGNAFKVLSLDSDRRKAFRIGVSSAIPDIHPYNHGDETAEVLKKLVYEPLLDINNDCMAKYCLAKEIVFEKNGEQALVRLNENKTFSDGTKLTAELVYNSYQWFIKQETAYNDLLSVIKEIKVINENTLSFVFHYANIDNIKVFNIPVIYMFDEKSFYGSTALGTGRYAVDTLTVYSEIVLKRNDEYGRKAKYKKVVIQAFDYGNLDSLLDAKDFDVFIITNKIADKIKENGAYNIYEMGNETGWYLEYNTENQDVRKAVANLAEGKEFFEATQDFGVYSKGIVSAYIKKPNYYSLLEKGNLKDTKSISFLHNYEAEANGIYRNLSAALKENGVETSENPMDIYEYHPDEFEEDVLIYYGKLTEVVDDEDNKSFFKNNSELDAEDYYEELEKHLASQNKITPLSKDTTWYASLAGRNNLDLFD